MKAYAYLRVSGLTQANEDASGLERQRGAIELYALAHDIEIVQWFSETFTGTDLDNRPAFQEMRQRLREGQVSTVVIEKLDRLARVLLYQESIIADFRKNDITLISVAEPDLNSEDPTRVLFRQILGAFAQYERSNLVARMRAGKVRTGRWGGKKRYGKDAAERPILDRIFHLRRNSFNASRIAEVLNAEGVTTRIGGKWHPTQVARIISRTNTSSSTENSHA
jgi:DNA invertase Pin-like site-specific DNA recombinase